MLPTLPPSIFNRPGWREVADQPMVQVNGLDLTGRLTFRNNRIGLGICRRLDGTDAIVHLDWLQPIAVEDDVEPTAPRKRSRQSDELLKIYV